MSLKDALNRANPNDLADIFRALKLGNMFRALTTWVYKQVPGTTPATTIAAVDTIALPNDAKCSKILRAYGRTGTHTGDLIVDVVPMTSAPTAGHVAFTEAGDIAFATTDVTLVDVEYVPFTGDVVSVSLPVVSDALAIPAALTARGVLTIAACTVDAGGVTGTFVVVAPSDSKPGTTKFCNLKVAKDVVLFKASDAVTRATVVLIVAPAADSNALLEASESPYI